MLSTRSVHNVSYRWLVCMQLMRIVHLILISGVRALNAAWILFHVSCRLCFLNFLAHIGEYFFLDEANTRFYCLMDHVKHFSLLTSLSFVRTKVKFQVILNCLTLIKISSLLLFYLLFTGELDYVSIHDRYLTTNTNKTLHYSSTVHWSTISHVTCKAVAHWSDV